MSGDIHRVGTATHFMVQFAATLVIIGAQIVIAFLLAPLLTLVALILIAIGAARGLCHAAAGARFRGAVKPHGH